MKVKDFDIDWNSGGVFTCCMSHVMEDDRPAKENMVIECEHCGIKMKLTRCSDGKLKWRGMK